MNTVNYRQRMTFFKENEEQFRLFLDEAQVSFTEGESETPVNGYSYTGDEADGSTLINAKDVNNENMRGKFISGLIRKRYSQDEVEAIILNGTSTEQHAQELDGLQNYREECKSKIDELLSRQ
ncbi:MAG: hypothetical protein II817_07415 [Bacteroidales bacterium]|jgi:hypothetical protein|nr:hypothetical protein [Bacteroidales bacterium]